MKLKLFIPSSFKRDKFLGEIEVDADKFNVIYNCVRKSISYSQIGDPNQKRPVLFYQRKRDCKSSLTFEDFQAFGVLVFGNHSDIHKLISQGRLI